MAKEIKLTQGYTTLVDDDLYEILNKFKWHTRMKRGIPYAVRNTKNEDKTIFKSKSIYITQYIFYLKGNLNKIKNKIIDHKDRNTLNNQYNNLRLCSALQNRRNQKLYSNNSSGYKGVNWSKEKQKWRTRIKVHNKEIFLGYFSSKEDAKKAYNQGAIKYHGEFASLNYGY